MKSMKDFYENYWSWRKETDYLYRQGPPVRVNIAISMVEKVNNRLVKLLDVGCGEGSLGKILREKFGSNIYMVGTDISIQAVELAKEYYNEALCLDVEKDSLKSLLRGQRFDYVVCLEVLEHIFDPKQLLKEIRGLTNQTGNMIVSFPNFAFYQYRLEVLKGNFPEKQHIYSDVEHLHYFTAPSFMKLLAESGLKPVEIDGEFAIPSFISFLPVSLKNRLTKAYPNFFGVQLVIKARKI